MSHQVDTVLQIRRYRSGDQQAVWELHNLALQQVGAHAGNGPWDGDLHDIERTYIDAGGEFLVGEIDGYGQEVRLRDPAPGYHNENRLLHSDFMRGTGSGR